MVQKLLENYLKQLTFISSLSSLSGTEIKFPSILEKVNVKSCIKEC